jgi:hypothetical protein
MITMTDKFNEESRLKDAVKLKEILDKDGLGILGLSRFRIGKRDRSRYYQKRDEEHSEIDPLDRYDKILFI